MLTLHRLGVWAVLGRSLKTTNCIQSVNALVEQRSKAVVYWCVAHRFHLKLHPSARIERDE